MRVQLRIDGGFAHIPGLARPVIVDTETVDAEVAEELRRLCAEIDSVAYARSDVSAAATPDARRYRLEIETVAGRQEIVATDPVTNPAIAALIAFMQRHRM